MAVVFFDGFDLYASASHLSRRGWTGNSPTNFQTGRFGSGQSFRTAQASTTNATTKTLTATDTLTVGFGHKNSNVGTNNANGSDYLVLFNGTTVICRMGITNAGQVRFGRGDYTTNLICQSASGLVITDAWNYFEVEFTRNGSTGAVNIYMNGALIASASGANTGASSIDKVGLMSGNGGNTDYDDFYLLDAATKLGEMKCEVVRPSADTATSDWTPLSGTDNFAMVDETLIDDDTTYNSSATVGQKDLFDLSDLSSTPASIAAVNIILTARKDDATAREIRHNMKNGATTTNGTTRALSASYVMYTDTYETNPDDSAPFTGADINAMQIGYEVVT